MALGFLSRKSSGQQSGWGIAWNLLGGYLEGVMETTEETGLQSSQRFQGERGQQIAGCLNNMDAGTGGAFPKTLANSSPLPHLHSS